VAGAPASVPALGLSGSDLLYVALALAGLGATGALTRQLTRRTA